MLRLAGLVLAALLTLALFETGVHSIHHASEAKCAGAAMAHHVSGTTVDPPTDARPMTFAALELVAMESSVHVRRLHCPDVGRAPPLPV